MHVRTFWRHLRCPPLARTRSFDFWFRIMKSITTYLHKHLGRQSHRLQHSAGSIHRCIKDDLKCQPCSRSVLIIHTLPCTSAHNMKIFHGQRRFMCTAPCCCCSMLEYQVPHLSASGLSVDGEGDVPVYSQTTSSQHSTLDMIRPSILQNAIACWLMS